MATRAEVVARIGPGRSVRGGPPPARSVERAHGGADRDRRGSSGRRRRRRAVVARRALPPGGTPHPVRPPVDPRPLHVRLPGRVGAAAASIACATSAAVPCASASGRSRTSTPATTSGSTRTWRASRRPLRTRSRCTRWRSSAPGCCGARTSRSRTSGPVRLGGGLLQLAEGRPARAAAAVRGARRVARARRPVPDRAAPVSAAGIVRRVGPDARPRGRAGRSRRCAATTFPPRRRGGSFRARARPCRAAARSRPAGSARGTRRPGRG